MLPMLHRQATFVVQMRVHILVLNPVDSISDMRATVLASFLVSLYLHPMFLIVCRHVLPRWQLNPLFRTLVASVKYGVLSGLISIVVDKFNHLLSLFHWIPLVHREGTFFLHRRLPYRVQLLSLLLDVVGQGQRHFSFLDICNLLHLLQVLNGPWWRHAD